MTTSYYDDLEKCFKVFCLNVLGSRDGKPFKPFYTASVTPATFYSLSDTA